MADAYTASDVGPVMVDGVAVPLSDAEATAKAAKWNANEAERAAVRAATATREARLEEIRAAMATRTASMPDMQEYLILKEE